MADQRLHLKNFAGGLSEDDTYGQKGSFGEGLGIDSRISPGYISLHRKLQKESVSIVTTEVHDGVRVDRGNGEIYLAGGTKIYKRVPGADGAAGTYTVDSADERLINVQDIDYRPDIDTVFLIDNILIHEISTVSGTPAYTYNKYREMIVNSQANTTTPVAFTADADTDSLISAGHGLVNGDVVLLQTTGALPEPLTIGTRYFVINASSDIFQVSLSGGGVAVDITDAGSGTNTFAREGYQLSSALIENDFWGFELDQEPIFSISFTVANKGTGDWTVILHDGSNHEIGAQVIENALLPVPGGDAQFTFDQPLRGKLGASYHAHLYSSDGSGAVQSTNAGTLQAAQASLKASRLVDTGDFGHVAIQLGARSYICNEKYIAEWEPLDTTDNASAGYNPHKLVAPSEVIYIGACLYNEYTVFGGGLKRGTDSNNDEPTEGILSFWNGVDDFISFNIPVPQGAPNSLFSINNVIHFEAKGTWYRWAGGDIEPIYQFPGVDKLLAAAAGPQSDSRRRAGRHVMAANPDNTLSIGFPYSTANTNLRIGLYSFGKSKSFMPPAINYQGLISTDHETVQFDESTEVHTPVTGITFLKRFGSNILVAWKDVVSGEVVYGVDYVNDTSPAVARGIFGSLWFDNDEPDKLKTPKAIKAIFTEPLPAGCSVTPFIQYDRSTTRVLGRTDTEEPLKASEGAMEVVYSLEVENTFYDALAGVILESTEGNFPYVKNISFKFDDNKADEADTEHERSWESITAEE